MATETVPELASEANSGGEEFGLAQLKELLGLFARAPHRHPRVAMASLFLTLIGGLAIAILAPRWYQSSVRILAQKNLVLPALGNPNRAVPREADSPTKNAADAILQHDNLVAMVKQLDLVDRWQSTRQPIQVLKDRVLGPLSPPRTDEDRLLDMVGMLEKQAAVGSDDASITISVEWPNRDLSYEIVSFLEKNFLEARYDSNVNVISEAIRILEERAKPQSAEVDAALADLTRIEDQRKHAAGGGARGGAPVRAVGRGRRVTVVVPSGAAATGAPAGAAGAGDDARGDVASELEDVRHRIALVKDDWDRQLVQTQNQLSDARATLGPMHPTVVALKEKISTLSGPSPELAPLVARERRLLAQIAQTPASAAAPAASAPATKVVTVDTGAGAPTTLAPVAAPAGDGPARPVDLRDDPEVALALSRLQAVSAKYNEMLSRIEAANIELEVTRAAFKYQYTVVRPAELPRKPSRPNVTIVLVASAVLALLLTFLFPGAVDLGRGRLVERWQIERKLGLPLLGELSELTTPR
jgi:uncharacterized protein involved in exopolysaccharide biosynthesis